MALSGLPDGAVIERKTPGDMASCIGANRERFEKELKRGRYVGRMIVVIEGTLADVCAASRGISHNAIVGNSGCLDPALLSFGFLWVRAEPQQTLRSEFSPPRSATQNVWPRL